MASFSADLWLKELQKAVDAGWEIPAILNIFCLEVNKKPARTVQSMYVTFS